MRSMIWHFTEAMPPKWIGKPQAAWANPESKTSYWLAKLTQPPILVDCSKPAPFPGKPEIRLFVRGRRKPLQPTTRSQPCAKRWSEICCRPEKEPDLQENGLQDESQLTRLHWQERIPGMSRGHGSRAFP